ASYTNRRSKLGEIAREIVRELFLQLVQILVLARNDGAAVRFSQLGELLLQTSRIGEFEQTNPVGLGAHDQRSQGTLHPVDNDAVGAFDMARRLAEGLPKGLAKTTGRLVAVRPACVIRFDPLADFQKRGAHASSP